MNVHRPAFGMHVSQTALFQHFDKWRLNMTFGSSIHWQLLIRSAWCSFVLVHTLVIDGTGTLSVVGQVRRILTNRCNQNRNLLLPSYKRESFTFQTDFRTVLRFRLSSFHFTVPATLSTTFSPPNTLQSKDLPPHLRTDRRQGRLNTGSSAITNIMYKSPTRSSVDTFGS